MPPTDTEAPKQLSTEEILKRLQEVPGAIDTLRAEFKKRDEGVEARLTAAEKKALEADQRAAAAEMKLRELTTATAKASFSLPGAEEEVRKGRVTTGDFIAASAVRIVAGEERSRRMFPLVHDISDETKKALSPEALNRTQVSHSGAIGGLLVPEQVSGTLVDLAWPATALSKLNMVRITNATGKPFRVVKLSGRGTAYMTAELPATLPSKSSITFGRASLTPRKCFCLGAVSKELDQLSNPAVRAQLENAFRMEIALKMEQQYEGGTGGEFQIRGLANYTNADDGILTYDATGTDNGVLTAAANGRDLRDYFMKRGAILVENNNGLAGGGKMHWLMPTQAKNVLKLQQIGLGAASQKPDAGATPIFGLGLISDEQLELLYGKIAHSTQFPTNLTVGGSSDGCRVYGGEWRNSWWVEWGGLQIEQADQAVLSNSSGVVTLNAFLEEALLLKVTTSFDAVHVRPGDVVKMTGFRSVPSGA